MSWLVKRRPRKFSLALVLTTSLLLSHLTLRLGLAQHSPVNPPYERGKEGEAFRGLSGRVLESRIDNPLALRAAPFVRGEYVRRSLFSRSGPADSPEQQVKNLLQQAQAAEKNKDYSQAAAAYQSILKIRPQWALIHQS